MITLILIVSIAGIIVSLVKMAKYLNEWGEKFRSHVCMAAVIVFGILVFVFGITLSYYINVAVDGKYIEEKISMYEEENEKIESDIDTITRQYMAHEGKVFDSAKVSSKITLVQLYPEMKSSEIVQKQIDVYNKNNAKIKKLKSERYKAKKARFYLYFGGNK